MFWGLLSPIGDAVAAAVAAAAQGEVAWLDEVDTVAAAGGPVVAMAAAAAGCLQQDVGSDCDELPDAKVTIGDVEIGNGVCDTDVAESC